MKTMRVTTLVHGSDGRRSIEGVYSLNTGEIADSNVAYSERE